MGIVSDAPLVVTISDNAVRCMATVTAIVAIAINATAPLTLPLTAALPLRPHSKIGFENKPSGRSPQQNQSPGQCISRDHKAEYRRRTL